MVSILLKLPACLVLVGKKINWCLGQLHAACFRQIIFVYVCLKELSYQAHSGHFIRQTIRKNRSNHFHIPKQKKQLPLTSTSNLTIFGHKSCCYGMSLLKVIYTWCLGTSSQRMAATIVVLTYSHPGTGHTIALESCKQQNLKLVTCKY